MTLPDPDDLANDITMFIMVILSWIVDAFVKNPIGTFVSIFGLLYAYERWRTQRMIFKNKLKEMEDEEKKRNHEG